MFKVKMYAYKTGNPHPAASERELSHIPASGDYLTFGEDSPWFIVGFVLRRAIEGRETEVELYCTELSPDTKEMLFEALYAEP